MSKAKAGKAVLNMALDAIGGVDDVARAAGKAVKAPKAAAAKALDAIADTADDWGWKGGKPGEITGGNYLKKVQKLSKDYNWNALEKLSLRTHRQLDQPGLVGDTYRKLLDTYVASGNKMPFAQRFAQEEVMKTFANMESAGIPRRLTAKAFPSFMTLRPTKRSWMRDLAGAPVFVPDYSLYKQAGAYLEPLTDIQRETFLALLPEWTGTLDDLAAAAKALG